MSRSATMQVRTYRGYRLQLRDDGGDGWIITIYQPNSNAREVLRNSVPNGFAVLFAEAKQRIDRRLDNIPYEAVHDP